jgi:hypothetical protein
MWKCNNGAGLTHFLLSLDSCRACPPARFGRTSLPRGARWSSGAWRHGTRRIRWRAARGWAGVRCVLDPLQRTLEVLFGLIIILIFARTIEANETRQVRPLLSRRSAVLSGGR